MTLKEKLRMFPDEEIIYLGTKHGSSWIWIGHANEVENAIAGMDGQFFMQKQTALHHVKNNIASIQPVIDGLLLKISETGEQAKVETVIWNNDKRDLKIAQSALKRQQEKEQYLAKYIRDWHNLIDREIMEEYTHTTDPVGTALLLAGDEVGKFSFYNEVNQSQKQNKGCHYRYGVGKKDGQKVVVLMQ